MKNSEHFMEIIMEQTASSEDILLSFDEESLFMKLPVKAARNQTTTGTTWRPK